MSPEAHARDAARAAILSEPLPYHADAMVLKAARNYLMLAESILRFHGNIAHEEVAPIVADLDRQIEEMEALS